MPNPPPAVRVLPMSSGEPEFRGLSANEVQREFFLGDLPTRDEPGKYYYRKRGIDAPPGSVVLFQFDSTIIASATLLGVERFDATEDGYDGLFEFDVDSIRVFDPVGPDRMTEIWPNDFKRFSQAKQELAPEAYPLFERTLTGIEIPAGPPPKASDIASPPADRVRTEVLRIIRDTQLANRVKNLHNFECQICGHTLILADDSRYAEGHHIQPLGTPHDGPDLMGNIICLCPNHHAACDLGAIPIVLSDLRQVSQHRISERFVKYHNEKIYRGLR